MSRTRRGNIFVSRSEGFYNGLQRLSAASRTSSSLPNPKSGMALIAVRRGAAR